MKFPLLTLPLFFLVAACPAVQAQLPTSELYAIQPSVIPAGKTTLVSLIGTNLEDLTALHFSDARIKAEPVLLPKTEFQKFARQDGTKFNVTVPADIPEGQVSVRAVGYFGMSTSWPLTIAKSDRILLSDSAQHEREKAADLPLDAIAYGRADADQIDWWKIDVKKGERILVHARAEQIGSWADATLTLVDSRGYELEHNRDYEGRDPLIDFTAKKDGSYWIGVYDFLYRGGAQYPYQLTATKGPWIDAVFPPAGTKGTNLPATVIGRNLPGGSLGDGLEIDEKPVETLSLQIPIPKEPTFPSFTPDKPSTAIVPAFPFSKIGDSQTNTVFIGLSDFPVLAEENDGELPVQSIPVEIAGRFDSNGDTDTYRFNVKKGINYRIEVIGDRIAGKIDPWLLVEKITKKDDGTESLTRIADRDDEGNNGGTTFNAGTRDASIGFNSDQDGEVKVTIVNQFDSGGPTHVYRLVARESKPDFDLIAVLERPYIDQRQMYPAAPFLRKGGTFPIRILAQRKNGFNGPIHLNVSGLPKGVTCPDVTLSGSEDICRVVLHAAPDAPAWHGTIQINGKAAASDGEIVRPARAGTLNRGSADYNNDRPASRLDADIPLAVSEYESAPAFVTVKGDRKFSVTMGQTLEIPVELPQKNDIKGNLTIVPTGLQGLAKPPTLTVAEKAKEGVLKLAFKEQKNVFAPKPGTWNFTLKATGVVKFKHNPQAAERDKEEQKHVEALLKQYTDAKNEEKRKLAETAKKEVTERATSTAKRAAQKDVNFSTYSLPLTVEIKPAPEPEKK